MNNKKLTDKEYKAVLLSMLEKFDAVCRKNNIQYSLIGGSLIGAIRDGSMIPWDDDIDVIADQKNYKKILKAFSNDMDGLKLLTPDNSADYYYPYAKIVSDSVAVVESNLKPINNYGAFIDIFVYHPVHSKSKMHYSKIMFFKHVLDGAITKNVKNDAKHKTLKKLRLLLLKNISGNRISKKYMKWVGNFTKEGKYMIANWPSYGVDKEYQNSDDIKAGYIDIFFNGVKVMVFKNYDNILKTTFGDYMTPPPKDKRVNKHNIEAYWKVGKE